MKNNTLKNPLYGNCRVQNPDGVHIFNCGYKKANWYLKRNLAIAIQQNPLVIRLQFQPNGLGHADNSFYLQDRKNVCVCCGRDDQLTKHHVVPYSYRRFFPEALKNHSAYDILPLCHSCHERYEIHAAQFKAQLLEEFNIKKQNIMAIDPSLKKVCLYASALLRHGDVSLPIERHNMMMNFIRSHLGREEITKSDLEQAARIQYNTRRDDYKPEGRCIVEKISNMESFNKRWRQHFLATLKPKYLPKYWTIDGPIKINN